MEIDLSDRAESGQQFEQLWPEDVLDRPVSADPFRTIESVKNTLLSPTLNIRGYVNGWVRTCGVYRKAGSGPGWLSFSWIVSPSKRQNKEPAHFGKSSIPWGKAQPWRRTASFDSGR